MNVVKVEAIVQGPTEGWKSRSCLVSTPLATVMREVSDVNVQEVRSMFLKDKEFVHSAI